MVKASNPSTTIISKVKTVICISSPTRNGNVWT
jgi:hypothetical protein